MAIYHCSIRNISRSSGKSAVASSAYRSGSKMYDEEIGKTFNYSLKKEVAYSEIILCKNAPREYQDRQVLWNEVQKVEKASNSRLAREWIVAIPHELSFEESKELLFGFGKSLAEEGMCIQLDMHLKEGNYHGHFMGTTRPIKENGEWGQKEKKAFKLDENGQKIPIIDEKTGKQKVRVRKGKGEEKLWERVTVDANDWNKKEKVEEWRKRWAEHCNRYLQEKDKVDHRSYKRQGIEQEPTIHEGYVARQMELKGEISEKCQLNRDIREYNAIVKWLKENIYDRIKKLFTKYRGMERDIEDSRRTAFGIRKTEIRTRARHYLNISTNGYDRKALAGEEGPAEPEHTIRYVNKELEQRKQQIEFRKSEIDRTESDISEVHKRESELRKSKLRESELARLEREREISEKYAKFLNTLNMVKDNDVIEKEGVKDERATENADNGRIIDVNGTTGPEHSETPAGEERPAERENRPAEPDNRTTGTDNKPAEHKEGPTETNQGPAEREEEIDFVYRGRSR